MHETYRNICMRGNSIFLQPSEQTSASARAAGAIARSGGVEHLRLDDNDYRRSIGVKSASKKDQDMPAMQQNPQTNETAPFDKVQIPDDHANGSVSKSAEASDIGSQDVLSSEAGLIGNGSDVSGMHQSKQDSSSETTNTEDPSRAVQIDQKIIASDSTGPTMSVEESKAPPTNESEQVPIVDAKDREESLSRLADILSDQAADMDAQVKEESLNKLSELLNNDEALAQVAQLPEAAKLAKLDELNTQISNIPTEKER